MKTCLTVDDSKVVRKVAKKMLEELGFNVREAGDGIEALAECVKEMPDCILLDWNMPNMDGLEFLKQFRANPQTSNVIIIFCTTMNDIAHISEAIASGANEYIMKPFDISIIKDKFIITGLLSS